MDVATTFLPLLQVFADEMTRPTFQTFLILVSGWQAAPRRTVLGIVRASGTRRHHAAFHRLFAIAQVPYFVWVSIATVLQLSITAMN